MVYLAKLNSLNTISIFLLFKLGNITSNQILNFARVRNNLEYPVIKKNIAPYKHSFTVSYAAESWNEKYSLINIVFIFGSYLREWPNLFVVAYLLHSLKF